MFRSRMTQAVLEARHSLALANQVLDNDTSYGVFVSLDNHRELWSYSRSVRDSNHNSIDHDEQSEGHMQSFFKVQTACLDHVIIRLGAKIR